MLRAIANIYIESQALTRRDAFQIFRVCNYSSVTVNDKTVLSSDGTKRESAALLAAPPVAPSAAPPPPSLPPPPPPRSSRAWSALAALAVTASLGGVYFYRKLNNGDKEDKPTELTTAVEAPLSADEEAEPPLPALAAELPAHAEFLLVGGGTAAFAAMRAIRSARPDAHVLLVGAESALPYMRPPLSKELWRERDPAAPPDRLSFRQWNGRRRNLAYEPDAFYTPPERMRDAPPGAALARGWRVEALDPAARRASLRAGDQRHELTYGRALLATGVRARRVPGLRAAAAAGRSLALRGVRDAARLARALDAPGVRTVAVVGGGFLATELSAALAERLAAEGAGRRVLQLFREPAPLAAVLPPYLAADVARRLAAAGVRLLPDAEVVGGELEADGARVRLQLAGGGDVGADLVVECVGSEPAVELAERAGLELHPELGGVLVNGELAARSGVWAAGDVACFYDEALGRRRVEHHDHAVVSGRLAGENMAGVAPPKTYHHQSMFWSDLGPQLGYEAIGIVDSRLPTVGVFSADAVAAEGVAALGTGEAPAAVGEPPVAVGEVLAGAGEAPTTEGESAESAGEAPRRYERGVVFYLREKRVVGVLLWNLFNRMHVARQVLSHGEFEDLFEVAKLFSPQEEE